MSDPVTPPGGGTVIPCHGKTAENETQRGILKWRQRKSTVFRGLAIRLTANFSMKQWKPEDSGMRLSVFEGKYLPIWNSISIENLSRQRYNKDIVR